MGTEPLEGRVTRSHWQRRSLLLLLVALAAALGLALLFQRNASTPPVIFSAFADAVLGIAVGAGTRLVLRHRYWLVRVIAAAGLVIFGLAILGQLTDGRSGVAPWQLLRMALYWIERAGVRLSALPMVTAPPGQIRDIAHIVLGVTVSWTTLRAWNASRRPQMPQQKTAVPFEPPEETMPEPVAIAASYADCPGRAGCPACAES